MIELAHFLGASAAAFACGLMIGVAIARSAWARAPDNHEAAFRELRLRGREMHAAGVSYAYNEAIGEVRSALIPALARLEQRSARAREDATSRNMRLVLPDEGPGRR